jgi:hypothetical protein
LSQSNPSEEKTRVYKVKRKRTWRGREGVTLEQGRSVESVYLLESLCALFYKPHVVS